MSKLSETKIKDIENAGHTVVHDAKALLQKIEAWFQRHFSHVTPGTPDHAVLTAAKEDLKATLTAPSPEQADTPATTPAA